MFPLTTAAANLKADYLYMDSSMVKVDKFYLHLPRPIFNGGLCTAVSHRNSQSLAAL
jgi:hypothetical protein